MPTMPTFMPGPTFQWRSGDQVVMPAHSKGAAAARSSPSGTFTTNLSDTTMRQLYIPPGFAHGFCVLSEEAGFLYKCTDMYSPADERGIIWNDPELAIAWPITAPLLSPKDQAYKCLADMTTELPRYIGR